MHTLQMTALSSAVSPLQSLMSVGKSYSSWTSGGWKCQLSYFMFASKVAPHAFSGTAKVASKISASPYILTFSLGQCICLQTTS